MAPGPAARLLDLLGSEPRLDDTLPPLWHWLYFLSWPPQDRLGADGHPRSGGFQPPVRERRRMFAGGRVRIERPLRFGRPATRTARLGGTTVKRGSSGELLFVTVRTEIVQDGRVAVEEEQDLVYRSGASAPAPPPPAPDAALEQDDAHSRPDGTAFTGDPLTLFRFSALTANSHRIHYDLEYARGVEGHAGLVVHGPLLALLMADRVRGRLAREAGFTFRYRFRRPLYAGQDAVVTARDTSAGTELAVIGTDGRTRASAGVGRPPRGSGRQETAAHGL